MDGDARTNSNIDITASILNLTYRPQLADLPKAVLRYAKQIWLDWIGVTIGGAQEPLVSILIEDAIDQNGDGRLTVAGRSEKLTLPDAVLVNAACSHALDYDDGNPQMMGHSSVVIVPVLFSIAERQRSSGRQVIEALLAAHETAMRVGNLVTAPEVYPRGFHCTSLLGGFGAAVGGAHVMGLSQEQAAAAMSIAGSQAAGLQSVFGSMTKPLNAGRCALNGLMGARLAARGFTVPLNLLGVRQGFADCFGTTLNSDKALATPNGGYFILNNWFKFHAACQQTHASAGAALAFREKHDLPPAEITRIQVHIPAFADRICNIQEPYTALQMKFSVRAVVALVLLGYDTGDPSVYSEETARNPQFIAMRDKIAVTAHGDQDHAIGKLEVTTRDGRSLAANYHNEESRPGIDEQERLLLIKFRGLVTPMIGADRADRLEAMIMSLETVQDFSEIAKLTALPTSNKHA